MSPWNVYIYTIGYLYTEIRLIALDTKVENINRIFSNIAYIAIASSKKGCLMHMRRAQR